MIKEKEMETTETEEIERELGNGPIEYSSISLNDIVRDWLIGLDKARKVARKVAIRNKIEKRAKKIKRLRKKK